MDTNTTIETTPETTETIDLRRWSHTPSPETGPTTPETSAETSAETVTVTSARGTSTRVVSLLPQYTQTPKRGAPRTMREPEKLLAYVRDHGPTLVLNPTVFAALEQRGLPKHRIVNAIHGLRKFYGIQITPTRTGRTVSSYTFAL